MQIVVHSVDKEEIPPVESLFEDSHLAKSTSFAARAKEDGIRSLRLDEDRCRHLGTTSELASNMPKEPVFRHTKSRMLAKSLNKERSVPKRDGAMWKGRATNLASKCTLDTRNLIF